MSTELLRDHFQTIRAIKEKGHVIGSHGHFHVVYKNAHRAAQDREISEKLLETHGLAKKPFYRAPKFSWKVSGQPYSDRAGHVSLLRSMWGVDSYKPSDILYLHPFDIVKSSMKAPNLFCKIWYSNPEKAWLKLTEIVCFTSLMV